ncbi:hypothetical protein FH041_14255 [Pseudomonas sp. SWI7]|uniref:ABC-three component system middle component 5 n=1 Tax=Pseudomonas sp. SWI7 TaxID=2587597 RepID=UPI001121E30F|nr:ABC-three component system middle component 5 [Pseudomonas sp. SWI7]QDC06015.1 hypothetical protein FH041_14255 [Pseudomonas sp. SWI7]
MLLYNKAVDVNHTLLRFAALILMLDVKVVELDRLRIYDFVVANPFHVSKLSLSQDLLKAKNVFKSYANRYQIYDPKGLFESMRPVQNIAILNLKEMGVLLEDAYSGRYLLQPDEIPDQLARIAQDKENSVSLQVLKFIEEHLVVMDLVGPKGLKQASGLMEYRYDVA